MTRDSHRSAIYHAEHILSDMFDLCAASGNPLVTIDDIALTLPPEARFGRIDDVQRHVDRVLDSEAIRATFGARPPISVRARNSAKCKAHYEPDTAVIAIPDTGQARSMLRELVLLHELSHHLDDATAESLKDGWLSTGDQGKLDDDGFLSITGRIKELFKLSNGKYVAPPAIEAKFATLCPYASQFMVFGEGKNFAAALVTLDEDSISGWAKDNGLSGKSYEDLTKSDAVHDMIAEHVDKLNASLNRWETIKKWAVLDHDLSVDGGQLTPSLKVKRGVVAEQNKETLDGFYS